MSVLLGTNDGVWQLNGQAERVGLRGKRVVHVANRGDLAVAVVPKDGLYLVAGQADRQLWEGDARAAAIAPDGSVYVGTEPAMIFRSDDRGATWHRSDGIDQLPTRSEWSFPPPP